MKKTICYLLLTAVMLFSLAVGCQPATPAPPEQTEPAESREPTIELKVDILGRLRSLSLDSEGRLDVSAELPSADGAVILSIDRDTRLLDKDGKPLSSIRMRTEPEPPPPPEEVCVVGDVYSLGPQDAILDPPLKLTISYDPQEIPEGVCECAISIMSYDEGSGWGDSHYSKVDTEHHRVTTQVNRFTRFAVITPLKAASPTPTVTITPTVKVDLLYFHRPQRCTKCLCFEERVSHVVKENFQNEINSGQLTFQVLNIADEENGALVKKYGVVGSQLFINTIVDGVENIRDVQEIRSWDCTSDTDRFEDEVKNTIEISLQGGQ